MPLHVVVGLQRGDEGKGRVTDYQARLNDVIVRGNGGPNAGHTIVPDGMEAIALHQIPSGIARPGKRNILANGMYLDPVRLRDEIAVMRAAGLEVSPKNLLISYAAHLIMPDHVELDILREASKSAQNTTKTGISFVAEDKYRREGQRVECIDNDPDGLFELAFEGLMKANRERPLLKRFGHRSKAIAKAEEWVEAALELKPYIADTVEVINDCLNDGQNVLAEGAQGFWLDINHGMYPEVTSSSTTTSGLLESLGVAPKHIGKVIGVAKVIKSHVGSGPFVTEITDPQLAAHIRGKRGEVDSEYGATTKRERRVGWPDVFELGVAAKVNGVDELILTKMDHVSRFGNVIHVATAYTRNGRTLRSVPSSAFLLRECEPVYETLPTWTGVRKTRRFTDLPPEAQNFVEIFENKLELPVTQVGVGPGGDDFAAR